MQILFLSGGGRHKTLTHLLAEGFHIQGLVVASGKNFLSRNRSVVDTAVTHGIPVHPVSRGQAGVLITQYAPDVVVSCGFPYLLSRSELQSAKCAINAHPSLLPKYRGFRSGPFVLMNGETESGVTVHFMTEEMDAGDIIHQESFPLSRFDTTKSVSRKCLELEPQVVSTALGLIRDDAVHPLPQKNEKSSTYRVLRQPKDSEVDWQKPLCELFNEIRACDPEAYPAFFMVDGQKVCIRLWRQDKPDDEQDMI